MNKKDMFISCLLALIAATVVFMSYTLYDMRKMQASTRAGIDASEIYREIDAIKKNQADLLASQQEIIRYLDSIETEILSVTNKALLGVKMQEKQRARELEKNTDKFMENLLKKP